MDKNNNMEINDSEVSEAISELMQEGKNLAPKTEWNQIMEDTKSVKLEETSLLEKIEKYKYLSAAASVLVVALIAASLTFALSGNGSGTVKTADERENTATTVDRNSNEKEPVKSEVEEDVESDDQTATSVPATSVPATSAPTNTTPEVELGITIPSRVRLVSSVPVGPAAQTQTYNVTFAWDAQASDVRFCGEVDVMEFEDNDPQKASHRIFNTGSTICDYDTQAIVGNTVTYSLELTKGNEVRFFIDAISLYDQKGTRSTSFIVS